jgi:hypothetical protein
MRNRAAFLTLVITAGLLIQSCAGCTGLILLGEAFPRLFASRWRLPDGTRVRFWIEPHNPPGRDKIKCLEVTPPGGKAQLYHFATWHAGYRHSELRANEDNTVIWVVDRETYEVGCCLDLRTGQFWDEGKGHPPGVGPDSGHVVR